MVSRIHEPTPEQLAEWGEWVASRPDSVRAVCERLDPWTLYRMKSTGQLVTLIAFAENGTVRVNVSSFYNGWHVIDRQVFGINPDDLEPTEPPAETYPSTMVTVWS